MPEYMLIPEYQDEFDIDNDTIPDLITRLQEIQESYPKTIRCRVTGDKVIAEFCKLSLAEGQYSDNKYIFIQNYRLKTDEDYAEEARNKAILAEQRQKRDYEDFLKLKKKFEGEKK